MLKFEHYCDKRGLYKEIETSRELLLQLNINPDAYFENLFTNPELWSKEPLEVLSEFHNPIRAGWAGLKGMYGAWTGNSRAKAYNTALQQLSKLDDQQLAQRGFSRNDLSSLEQMRANAAKEAASGGFGAGYSADVEAQKDERTKRAEAKMDEKIRRLLGKDAYSQTPRPGYDQQQAQQQQGQNPQQVQQTQQQSPQQTAAGINPQSVKQVQTHLAGLNQAIQGLLGA